MRRIAGFIAIAFAALGLATGALAGTPEPTSTLVATLTPSSTQVLPTQTSGTETAVPEGVTYVLQVQVSEGNPAPDGTIVQFGNANLPPPSSQAQTRQLCGNAIVTNGEVQITAQFNPDCPAGSQAFIVISRPQGWITAAVLCGKAAQEPCSVDNGAGNCGDNLCLPWIDWRLAQAGEGPVHLVVQAIPPSEAEGAAAPASIAPPRTGDGGLR